MLRVKNWERFQHYKDRNPPWIKLHRALLDDYAFSQLPDSAKGILPLIWILAAGSGGEIPDDPRFIQSKLCLQKPPNLQILVKSGFLIKDLEETKTTETETEREAEQIASNMLATRKPGSRLPDGWLPGETEREFAVSRGFSLNQVTNIVDTFCDYWHSQPGQRGVKLNWSLMWKNWIRREGKPAATRTNGHGFPTHIVEEWQKDRLSGATVRTKDEAVSLLRKQYPDGYPT